MIESVRDNLVYSAIENKDESKSLEEDKEEKEDDLLALFTTNIAKKEKEQRMSKQK